MSKVSYFFYVLHLQIGLKGASTVEQTKTKLNCRLA